MTLMHVDKYLVVQEALEVLGDTNTACQLLQPPASPEGWCQSCRRWNVPSSLAGSNHVERKKGWEKKTNIAKWRMESILWTQALTALKMAFLVRNKSASPHFERSWRPNGWHKVIYSGTLVQMSYVEVSGIKIATTAGRWIISPKQNRNPWKSVFLHKTGHTRKLSTYFFRFHLVATSHSLFDTKLMKMENFIVAEDGWNSKKFRH